MCFPNDVKRLYHVIEDVTEIIWVDVRSSLGIDNKESVWWPGRVFCSMTCLK